MRVKRWTLGQREHQVATVHKKWENIHTFIVTPNLGFSVTMFNYTYIITTYELAKKEKTCNVRRKKWVNKY